MMACLVTALNCVVIVNANVCLFGFLLFHLELFANCDLGVLVCPLLCRSIISIQKQQQTPRTEQTKHC